MQLVAYGAQDVYLTGNPQITFFKVVYRRHTNFSMEAIRQTFKGTVAAGARVVATISRNGDLVHDCFLDVQCGGVITASSINPGHNIIDNIELEIGGQLIDKHYGHWMEAHAELTEAGGVSVAKGGDQSFQYGTGDGAGPYNPNMFQITAGAGGVKLGAGSAAPAAYKFLVPLRFWFCRHVGLALPLIALQYHEVNINVKFTSTVYDGVVDLGTAPDGPGNVQLWCNYIYLDTDERRRFAQVSHEYLIEQVQHQEFTVADGNNTFKLNLNHPVKELIWGQMAVAWGSTLDTSGRFRSTNATTPQYQIKLNGHDRFEKQDAQYFSRYQPMKYHTGMGKSDTLDTLNVYSFALKPEEHQPSGTCNFSRIDNAQLIGDNMNATSGGTALHCYAVNYNVLRIMSGMGGLAYSN